MKSFRPIRMIISHRGARAKQVVVSLCFATVYLVAILACSFWAQLMITLRRCWSLCSAVAILVLLGEEYAGHPIQIAAMALSQGNYSGHSHPLLSINVFSLLSPQ
ncbi:unnamed protein product [Polarella glacialis]|uniref:Uncharacterized protein n=1 Tax=Polarella glacialis TaxID=89957 RepID=A0A813GH36_POLGL|nr:unnamed protein product [Polarella glacialis]